MTEQTPATEAASDIGRRNIERYLDHEYGISTNDAELGGLLDGWRDAIEAEARAPSMEAWRAQYNSGRADALRDAADAVRDIPKDEGDTGASRYINGMDYIALPAIIAILDPEETP